MEGTTKEYNEIKTGITTLLEQFPRCRNSDSYLILKYWESTGKATHYGPQKWLVSENELPSAESITRARRDIQNTQGKYLPTDPTVAIRRAIKQAKMREWFGSTSKEYLEYQNAVCEVK